MTIYKVSPSLDGYQNMEAYFVSLSSAIKAMNDNMVEQCKKWAVRYEFIRTEKKDEIIYLFFKVSTEYAISPEKSIPAIWLVTLNEEYRKEKEDVGTK